MLGYGLFDAGYGLLDAGNKLLGAGNGFVDAGCYYTLYTAARIKINIAGNCEFFYTAASGLEDRQQNNCQAQHCTYFYKVKQKHTPQL